MLSYRQAIRFPAGYHTTNQNRAMGDKSPKANQKKSEQKKAKAGQANQVKKQAEAAKQVPGKK